MTLNELKINGANSDGFTHNPASFKCELFNNSEIYTLNSDILKFIPKYLIKDFLRGYFDGDGNVMFGKKYTSGIKYNINICGNEEFLLNTYQIFFPSTNKMYFDKKSKQTFIWKISSKNKYDKSFKIKVDKKRKK